MSLTAEEKRELLEELKAELQRENERDSVYRFTWPRVCNRFKKEIDEYGSRNAYKIKDSVSSLLRSAYGISRICYLSPEQEEDAAEFFASILEMMRKLSEKNKGPER